MRDLTLEVWFSYIKEKEDERSSRWRSLEAFQALEYTNFWFRDQGISDEEDERIEKYQVSFCESYYQMISCESVGECYKAFSEKFREVCSLILRIFKRSSPSFVSC